VKYIDEFRDSELSRKLALKITELAGTDKVQLMEVCGTHTMSIHKFGIKSLLPKNIRLISGPGCPVCVTPNEYMDRAIALSLKPGVLVTSFGDMLRVPGSSQSLEQARAQGGKVRVVYSPTDALKIAAENPATQVVFLAVGFETTSPLIAATVMQAEQQGINNFFVLVGHKLVPPAMSALVQNKRVAVDGFICPAHVSAIIGTRPYQFLADKHRIPCVVAGFEPVDVLQGILMLLEMIRDKNPAVKNQYSRVATESGNVRAQELLDKVFASGDSNWRGLGMIPGSGYGLRDQFRGRDAARMIEVEVEPVREHKGCKCGEVLQGLIEPDQCPLYAKPCTPENPIGPCMVSSEGTCAAHYKYGGVES
jgi:hydrogenase expression/formation protein HypD